MAECWQIPLRWPTTSFWQIRLRHRGFTLSTQPTESKRDNVRDKFDDSHTKLNPTRLQERLQRYPRGEHMASASMQRARALERDRKKFKSKIDEDNASKRKMDAFSIIRKCHCKVHCRIPRRRFWGDAWKRNQMNRVNAFPKTCRWYEGFRFDLFRRMEPFHRSRRVRLIFSEIIGET